MSKKNNNDIVNIKQDENDGKLIVTSKELFELSKKEGATEPYNKGLRKIDAFFNTNVKDAIKKGWTTFQIYDVNDAKKQGTLDSNKRNIHLLITNAIYDNNREQNLKKYMMQ